MAEAAEMRVMVMSPTVDAARLQRCQIAGGILALGGPTAWRGVSDSPLHLPSSGNRVNAVAVSYDAVGASGNASGDLEKLK